MNNIAAAILLAAVVCLCFFVSPCFFASSFVSANVYAVAPEGNIWGKSFEDKSDVVENYAEESDVVVVDSMQELAAESAQLDANPSFGSDDTSEYSTYAYKSLILDAPYSDSIESFGAEEVYYYDDFYLLNYESEEATQNAYEALAGIYGEESVIPNIPMRAEENVDSRKIYGWGTYYMSMDSQKNKSYDNTVTVAVIDTGITAGHEIFRDTDIVYPCDLVNNISGSAVDDEGHGTGVCGIIAESTGSNVRIMPVKALDRDRYCSALTLLAAIEYADKMGADIINMSLGGDIKNKAVFDYLENKLDKCNALLVCASGNEGVNMDNPGVYEFPAESVHTVCTGSIDSSGTGSSFSNYGKAVDFAAPGESLILAYNDGYYCTADGTSFASPYIASAAAVLKSENYSLDNDDIKNGLISLSVDMGAPGKDVHCGNGCPVIADELFPFRFVPDITLSKTSYAYTGKAVSPALTVKCGDKTLQKGTDYTVSYMTDRMSIGKQRAIVNLKGHYSGSKSFSFKIVKGSNKLKVKAKTAVVRKSALRRKTQQIAAGKLMTVKNAAGKLSYKKISGSSRLTINKKTGKFSVRKGTGKGKYRIKVKVTAAGNRTYKAGSRTLTLTVRVR